MYTKEKVENDAKVENERSDPCTCTSSRKISSRAHKTCSATCASNVLEFPRHCEHVATDAMRLICTRHFNKTIRNIQCLTRVYDPEYVYEPWTTTVFAAHTNLWAAARVLYDSEAPIHTVIKLSREREPTNINGTPLFKQRLMARYFKWSTSYYKRFYAEHHELPPNIGVYTPTQISVGSDMLEPATTTVHVYNAIGYAFDSTTQVDYQYFQRKHQYLGSHTCNQELKDLYKTVFVKIFECARSLGLTHVVMSLVGLGCFATHYPKLALHVWVPAFVSVFRMYRKHVSVLFSGKGQPLVTQELTQHSIPVEHIGCFPDNIRVLQDSKALRLESVLFVNAWDPLSFPGNGHKGDNSLDGYFGRHSHIALSGNFLTNPLLSFHPVSLKSSRMYDRLRQLNLTSVQFMNMPFANGKIYTRSKKPEYKAQVSWKSIACTQELRINNVTIKTMCLSNTTAGAEKVFVKEFHNFAEYAKALQSDKVSKETHDKLWALLLHKAVYLKKKSSTTI